MTSLDNIPLEILIDILSYLPCTDLACISRVSQYLHVVSQSVLYKSPVIKKSNIASPPSLPLLLRTLLSPGGERLVNTIHSLQLGCDNTDIKLTVHNQSDFTIFAAAASRLGIHDPLTENGAQIAILLHLIPRLEFLTLNAPPFHDPIADLTRAHPAGTLPATFNHIRDFKCFSSDRSGIRVASLLILFHLPNIRSIDVHLIYDTLDATVAASTSTVRKLRFSNCDLPSSLLDLVLNIPIALTHFSYLPKSREMGYTIAPLLRALEAQKSTLQYLQVDLGGVYHSAPFTYPMVSLREWPVLRTVSVSLFGLLGQRKRDVGLADVLPSVLRELEVLWDMYWTVAQGLGETVALLKRKEEVEGLEKVVLAMGERRGLRSGEELRMVGESAGVVIVDSAAGGGRRVKRHIIRTKIQSCYRGPHPG